MKFKDPYVRKFYIDYCTKHPYRVKLDDEIKELFGLHSPVHLLQLAYSVASRKHPITYICSDPSYFPLFFNKKYYDQMVK